MEGDKAETNVRVKSMFQVSVCLYIKACLLFCKLSVIRSCRCLPQLNLGLLKIQLDPACSPMYDVLQSHGLTANSLCIRAKQPCIVSNSVVFKDPASTCWRRDGLDGCCC